MAYTNATFYLDYESGSDAARTALTSVAVANNGSGLVRCTKAAHGLVTGAVVDVTLNYAGAWIVTVIDSSNFDLVGSAYSTATAVTVTPRGGASKADAWQTITSGATSARLAAGDTVRVKASPDPTSLGQSATWTDGPLKATVAIASSTNATPIVVTLTAGNYTTLAPAVGDTVIVNGHTTNTNANGVWKVSAVNGSTTLTLVNADASNSVGNGVGAGTGTVRKATNMAVTLTTAVTQTIALTGNRGTKTNWSASANITPTVISTDYKEGGECQQIDVAAAFATGLAAYFATGTLNLSGYQQVSFWIKQTAGTLGAASSLSLKLCSDAAGVTAVNTLNLPAFGALNQWTPITIDTGGALGSSIASVAFYVNTDNAAQTFLIDNIVACKASSSADSLSLTSLISKNSGSEAWFGIQSINGTRVMLDAISSTIPGATPQRGYSGVTESVTTYKRETIKTVMAASGATVQQINKSGTVGNLISFLGGWDRTSMTSQSGQTWFDGQNGLGVGVFDSGTSSFNYLDKLNFTRYTSGLSFSASDNAIGAASLCNTASSPINVAGARFAANTLSAVQCGGAITLGPLSVVTTVARADGFASGNGLTLGAASSVGTVTQANNNTSNGVAAAANSGIGTIAAAHGNGGSGYSAAINSVCGSVTANLNSAVGVDNSPAGSRVLGGSTSGNGAAGVRASGGGTISLRNFTASDTTPFTVNTANSGGYIYSENNGGVAGAHLITSDGGTIVSDTSQRHTASGIAWKFLPTSTNRSLAWYPLRLSVAKIVCTANVAKNVTIWTRRDNTNITGRLRVRALQLTGIPSDVTVDCAPTINTWTQSSTLTFTPTESGVVELEFLVGDGVGTTNSFWIDDLAVT